MSDEGAWWRRQERLHHAPATSACTAHVRHRHLPRRRTPQDVQGRSAGAERRLTGCPCCRRICPGCKRWSSTRAASWGRSIGAGRLPARLHTGDCWDTGKRCVPAAAEQVCRLLAQGVPACIHCCPDTALGVLE
ncbi:DUF6233 domain-containing protein [Streptomyces erythrochromogenes]|uniref:DUF6233 domain-containing protein n=1 Tax=Streptomyces erythrochromogenes TaxID=285574 RepID=UPI003432D8B3